MMAVMHYVYKQCRPLRKAFVGLLSSVIADDSIKKGFVTHMLKLL